jgi:hypothetical protein
LTTQAKGGIFIFGGIIPMKQHVKYIEIKRTALNLYQGWKKKNPNKTIPRGVFKKFIVMAFKDQGLDALDGSDEITQRWFSAISTELGSRGGQATANKKLAEKMSDELADKEAAIAESRKKVRAEKAAKKQVQPDAAAAEKNSVQQKQNAQTTFSCCGGGEEIYPTSPKKKIRRRRDKYAHHPTLPGLDE